MPQSDITVATSEVLTSDEGDTTANIKFQTELQITDIKITQKQFYYLIVSAIIILILQILQYIILFIKFI